VTAFLDSTAKQIERRLAELRTEISKLEAARTALGAEEPGSQRRQRRTSPTSPASRRRGASSSRTPTGTGSAGSSASRRRSGARATRVLELVHERPGVTISDLAQAMKIQPSYLYRVLPRLASDGRVRREGRGWHPAT
jgi:CRP-like cAMP-binding protein